VGGRITDMFLDGTNGSAHLTGDTSKPVFKSTWWILRPTSTGPARVPRT
jgi:hypothetical protein